MIALSSSFTSVRVRGGTIRLGQLAAPGAEPEQPITGQLGAVQVPGIVPGQHRGGGECQVGTGRRAHRGQAGALGVGVWTMLPTVPDWRWGLEGDSTSWYPAMRLFRQEDRGKWEPVISRIAEELSSLVERG